VSVEKLISLKFILHISYMGENLGMAPFCWVVWSREGGGISVARIDQKIGEFHQTLDTTKLENSN
jgi:hypothetical protein